MYSIVSQQKLHEELNVMSRSDTRLYLAVY
jgi:hypothetical protein